MPRPPVRPATGATTSLPNTHDVGTRTSWNLRPEVAFLTPDWQQKRAEMKRICSNCHAGDWVENFYFQYDALVNMSNDKFFIPARDVMKKLAAAGKITNIPFDSQIKVDLLRAVATPGPPRTHWRIHDGQRLRAMAWHV